MPVPFTVHQRPAVRPVNTYPLQGDNWFVRNALGLWAFTESGGHVQDLKSRASNTFSGPLWKPVLGGMGLSFNGSSDLVAMSSTLYRPSPPRWHWVRVRFDAVYTALYVGCALSDYESSGAYNTVEFGIDNTNTSQYNWNNSTNPQQVLGPVVVNGRWYDMLGCVDAALASHFYVNGVLVGTTASNGGNDNGAIGSMTFGRAGDYNGNYLSCTIRSCGIGTGTPNAQQIRELYDNPHAPFWR